LCLTPSAERFPWDDLREIFSGCQQMARVPNAVEILRKIWSLAFSYVGSITARHWSSGRETNFAA